MATTTLAIISRFSSLLFTMLFNYLKLALSHFKWALDCLLYHPFHSLRLHHHQPLQEIHHIFTEEEQVEIWHPREGGGEEVECAVCLNKIGEGDEVRVLRCEHVFHRECLNQWVGLRNFTCPLCRHFLGSGFRSVVNGDGGEALHCPLALFPSSASPPQFMASKEKHNARWDRCTTKKLLEICVKEIRISGKPGVSFKARRWEVVVDEFNKRANKNYNQKQLKNRLDNLKLDWTTWKQLLGKETGLGWNHETVTIVADDTWWEAKIKDNSKYAKFRYQGLEFREELEIIFGETVATSQCSWTPATGAPSEDSSIKTNPTIPEEIDEYDEEETNLDEDASHMVNNQLKRKKIASEAMSKKLAKGKQKSGIATSMLKTLDRMANAAESHMQLKQLKCHKHLKSMDTFPFRMVLKY
ncbi:hypothetical protein K1719_032324 [Acacia pycnantha]|nr:hypothetical protein K1719_032324 [Acacia pycnantha]